MISGPHRPRRARRQRLRVARKCVPPIRLLSWRRHPPTPTRRCFRTSRSTPASDVDCHAHCARQLMSQLAALQSAGAQRPGPN
ncbi:MAG: hypothetical protein AMJ72_09480 [Acidithiobacillales bacterium SM1_46]|nr:MAG: hypothetical protein AMJ72_09480 [Acidithiobacillales bacterium SM1_46]